MDIQKLQRHCEQNGFEFICVKNSAEALDKAKEFIKNGMSIGFGGSESVKEIGLYDYLLTRNDVVLHNQYEGGISEDENIKRRKDGITADIFITSSNAITEIGELINCDGSGNRVAAQIFGSKKLLLIIGKNKVVKDVKAGFERVENIAAVKNAQRLNERAVFFGKTPKYNVKNVCQKWSIITQESIGRISIIFVDEELGF